MLLHDCPIPVEDIFVLADQPDFEQITSFKLCDVSTAKYQQLRNYPYGDTVTGAPGVPENKLPIQKLQYHFMSRKVDPCVFKQAEQEIKPHRLEPNTQGLQEYISKVKKYA